jgi:hypothetical protein
VVIQEVWRNRLWSARPVTVVRDDGDSLALWCPEGTLWKTATTPPTRARASTRAARFAANLTLCDWTLADFSWDGETLCLVRAGDWYAVRVAWWDRQSAATAELQEVSLGDSAFRGWYVNFQQPFRRTAEGLQTMDLMLDLLVDPDRSWRWKDEDELEAMVTSGVFAASIVEQVRETGRLVVSRIAQPAPPFDSAWRGWRPDPSWEVPVLSDGWDRI